MSVRVLTDARGLHVEEVQVGLPRPGGFKHGTADYQHERTVGICVRLDLSGVEEPVGFVDLGDRDFLRLRMRLMAGLARPRGDLIDRPVRRGGHRGHGFGVCGIELERVVAVVPGRDEEREGEVDDEERDERARDPRPHHAERALHIAEAAAASAERVAASVERVAAAERAARVPRLFRSAVLGLEQRGGLIARFVGLVVHRRGWLDGIGLGVHRFGVHRQEPLDLGLEVLLLAHRDNRARFDRM
mmetsp:Transcript_167/g.770  ORF Transcript_167/g.770 Transcript_167/m.770 type:complete len:245 (+) Transcript_167:1025-1759(+)